MRVFRGDASVFWSFCSCGFVGAGIIAAIVWFPLGIGLCLLDRSVTCKRCGAIIKGGPGIHLGGSNRRR